jgi:hypothetical protein
LFINDALYLWKGKIRSVQWSLINPDTLIPRKIVRIKAPPKVLNSKVKDQRVKVIVSNERSCQKEYTCEI